ncbi:degenerin del-1-like [Ostrinia nubilalis]|uniref:degenerin del-1-like n=1 Tax=Ostrinia nubilalis TaxID=29057 RepID=UPI00308223B9
MITDCRFNGEEFPCCEKFRMVDSEYGYCFSFNTLQSESSRDEPLYAVNRSTGPGLLTYRLLYDAYISVHSPEELSTNNLDFKFKFDVKARSENRVQFLFSMVEMENDPMLLAEGIDVRHCRNLEEVPERKFHTYPVYSYGACRLAQETEHFYEHCGCIHPARHTSYETMYCNYTGLNCVVDVEVQKQKLGADKHDNHDKTCLPSCVESELTTIHISRNWVNEEYQGALVSIRMASLPTLRYTRNLVRTDLDFVVSIGGMVSLFTGASILSIVEVLYLVFRSPRRM